MSFSIFSEFEHWVSQVKSILLFKLNHLTPNDYTVMLVLCICIGYCLLRNRN